MVEKKRGKSFFKKEAEFLSGIDELFNVFCENPAQLRRLEREHKLQMADEDYSFYNDQKGLRIAKCLDVLLPLTLSDKQLVRRSQIKPSYSTCPSEMEIESAANNVSESESTYTNSSPS